MVGIKTVMAAALMSLIAHAPSFAQGFSEPAAFQATNPNRDVLNGGALTPAARLGLEQYGASNAYAGERPDASPGVRRHRLQSPASRRVRP
nr:hypothetical protein [Bradyrhizobium sp.]